MWCSTWVESFATSRPYRPLGGSWLYPALGTGQKLHRKPSLSPNHRDSVVFGTGHGERASPRAVTILDLEGLGGKHCLAWGVAIGHREKLKGIQHST